MAKKFILIIFIFIYGIQSWASNPNHSWYTESKDKKVVINVELFLSSTCPHCHKADAFFQEIEPITPWLKVTRFIINDDKAALLRFNQLLNEQNMDDFAVPSVFFCNSRWVGFVSAETTGKDLLYALNYCKKQIEKNGVLTTPTEDVLKRWANANLFDSGMTENPTAMHYILVVALMDAYNPCALFGLAGFFAFLFLQGTRKGQLMSGILYIAMIGIMHYFQQTHTSTFFEWLPWFRIPVFLVSILGLYFLYRYINNPIKPWIILISTVLTALIIQGYQQTCVMNWSYIFEQWLFNQHLPNGQMALFELAYQLIYLIPLVLIGVLYLILIKIKRVGPHIYRLTNIGILLLYMIYLLLIVYPESLSNFGFSLLVNCVVVIIGWFVRLKKPNVFTHNNESY